MKSLAYHISAKSRAKKHAFFLSHILPTPTDTILDVGANALEYSDTDNYLEKHYPYPKQITVVSLDDPSALQKLYPEITCLQADGTKLPFADNEFTIAYSNAVIEHVGTLEAQLAFLKELARVSQRGYLTTPNRHFPIEVHTRDYMSLLSKQDLLSLVELATIPNPVLTPHRFCGFIMTYTLTWSK